LHRGFEMVLIGHSLGGLLCKMVTQDSGSKLWNLMTGCPYENLAGPEKARELLHGSLVFMPIPEVRRLIFITTPHRGSPLVCGPIREVGTRLVRPPTPLQQARASLLACNGPDAFTRTFREGLATSIDELPGNIPFSWPSTACQSIRVSSGIQSSPSGTALSARVGATARCRTPVHTTRAQPPS
jgi:hypothetical protein